jgi:AcrR family transcriptional regulator
MMSIARTPRPDPLTEILLCPTTGRAVDAPTLPTERRTERSTTALTRSRTAILAGARRAVEVSGAKITMSQVAITAGVAKATLYNHFRTRDDVLRALLVDEIEWLIGQIGHLELSAALTRAAIVLSEHPLLEALAADDAALLAALARVDVRGPGWALVAGATENLLNRAGRHGTPTVLRWLSSFVTAPADERDIAADVDVLVAGLPPRPVDAISDVARPARGA